MVCRRSVLLGIALFLAFVTSAFAQGPAQEITINKRPFVDLAERVNDILGEKRLDLDVPFLVIASGTLDQSGKIKASTFNFIKVESASPRMLDVVRSAIAAFNDSGYMHYLSNLGVSDVRMLAEQDGNNVRFSLESQFANEVRSKSVSSMVTTMIDMKKRERSEHAVTQAERDDLRLLQGATSEADGKTWRLNLLIPKTEFHELIERKLAEQKMTDKSKP